MAPRGGVFGGTGQEYLNQNYINGMPVSAINAQGDPTTVRNAVSVDAIDQFQVKTNGAGVQFGGAGVTNYTIKSGGDRIHGTVFDYIRNTALDTWGYFSKVPAGNGYAIKPGEHQNSYGGSLGGPILKNKMFYFGTYEGFHYTKISNTPQYLTVPTLRERVGDFTDAFGTGDASQNGVAGIWDPVPGGNRNQFRGLLNGVPTFNVIPQQEISSISTYLAQALPVPTTTAISNNYLAGLPLENDDYRVNVRVDYTISQKHKVSIIGLGGNNGYNTIPKYNSQIELPFPYAAGTFQSQKAANGIITYTFIATQHLINTLNYGYTRTWGQSFSPTQGTKYTAAAAGIGGLPAGNSSSTFPSISFGGGGTSAQIAPTSWAANVNSGPQATNTYTIIDNLLWVKGPAQPDVRSSGAMAGYECCILRWIQRPIEPVLQRVQHRESELHQRRRCERSAGRLGLCELSCRCALHGKRAHADHLGCRWPLQAHRTIYSGQLAYHAEADRAAWCAL